MKSPLEILNPASLTGLRVYLDALVKGRMWMKILIAIVLGLGFGLLIGPAAGLVDLDTASVYAHWLSFPGQLFLVLVQMIVLPLIFSSIVKGLALSEDTLQLKKLGFRVVVYFILTTGIAIVIGITLASIFEPGRYIDTQLIKQLSRENVGAVPNITADVPIIEQPTELSDLEDIPENLINLLPENPMSAMLNLQMLQVVIFAIIIGIALLTMSQVQSKPLISLLDSLQAVCMTVFRWAMELAPFAVFGLMANLPSQVGFQVLLGMAAYVGTVLAGFLVLLIFYLGLVSIIGRKAPLRFLHDIGDVQLLAFATSSTAAVIPLSMDVAEKRLDVRPSIAHFLIPLGATINMDGMALYQGVATVFLAQIFGVQLSLASLVLITVTAVFASIGAPATPGAGIAILAMVLESAGIPTEGIALIIGVDRILDMSRTAINVTGDLTACTVMDRWIGKNNQHENKAENSQQN